jgi:NTE family protein
VTSGLLPSEKVRNVFQMLLQIAFFRESEDTKKEVPLCDIYIPVDLEGYNMGSFIDADEILQKGIEEGRQLYPRFKKIADSLNAIYGVQSINKNRLPKTDKVTISSIEVKGLEKTTHDFFIHTMDFFTNRTYTAKELSNRVRRAFGTRYYKRIFYSLQPKEDGTCHIIFDVVENPLTFAKIGLHYSRFTGIGIIGNFTTRNFFTPNSRSLVTVNLGESFRIKGEHLQYIGRLKNFAFTLKTQFDRFDFTTYQQYKESGSYTQNFWEVSSRLHYSPGRNFTIGLGHRFEWLLYNPNIIPDLALKGKNEFNTFFTYLTHNTLNRNTFPTKGVKIEAEGGRTLRQNPRLSFLVNGEEPNDPDSLRVDKKPFFYTNLSAEGYLPLSRNTTAFLVAQSGINFNYSRNILNEYVAGGMVKFFRHQIVFAGLQEGTVYSPALAMIQGGVRTEVANNIYITGRANILFNNIISRSDFYKDRNFYSGYALTFSYNFALGPLDLSIMYCDQTKNLQTYINLGIPF